MRKIKSDAIEIVSRFFRSGPFISIRPLFDRLKSIDADALLIVIDRKLMNGTNRNE